MAWAGEVHRHDPAHAAAAADEILAVPAIDRHPQSEPVGRADIALDRTDRRPGGVGGEHLGLYDRGRRVRHIGEAGAGESGAVGRDVRDGRGGLGIQVRRSTREGAQSAHGRRQPTGPASKNAAPRPHRLFPNPAAGSIADNRTMLADRSRRGTLRSAHIDCERRKPRLCVHCLEQV